MTLFEYLESKYEKDHDTTVDSAADFLDWCETYLRKFPPADPVYSRGRIGITMADKTIVTVSGFDADEVSMQDTSIPITGLLDQDGSINSQAIPIT